MSVTKRETSETSIRVELKAGAGITKIETGNGFLDHMLNAFARYSGLALDIKASSDLKHHLVEDVALTLGRAFRAIIPAGAARYGNRVVPMDDALVQVSVDIGGRPLDAVVQQRGGRDHPCRGLARERSSSRGRSSLQGPRTRSS